VILSQLMTFIFERGSASRSELAKAFALSEDGVDAMLEIWVRKGRLSRLVDLNKQANIRQVRYRAVKDDAIQMTVIS
jgi:putative ferrous iron transport protein C